jgi:hypothetical protein
MHSHVDMLFVGCLMTLSVLRYLASDGMMKDEK